MRETVRDGEREACVSGPSEVEAWMISDVTPGRRNGKELNVNKKTRHIISYLFQRKNKSEPPPMR